VATHRLALEDRQTSLHADQHDVRRQSLVRGGPVDRKDGVEVAHGADGVAVGDRTALDVDDVLGQRALAQTGQRDCGERLAGRAGDDNVHFEVRQPAGTTR
jgi:hypothetical protein